MPELTLLQTTEPNVKWLLPSSREVISCYAFLGTPFFSPWKRKVPAAVSCNFDTCYCRVEILLLKNKLMQFHSLIM